MNNLFWEKQAEKLDWYKKWKSVIAGERPYKRWFTGGKLNASYQCLDRHIKNGLGQKIAIYWINELGESQSFSYKQVYDEVNRLAFGLNNLGVKKGDVVVIYMPMIVQAIFSMLAVARVGAIHNVVFSAFSYKSLKDRIIDTNAKFLITADYSLRRGKFIDLKFVADLASHETSIQKVIVVKRTNLDISLDPEKDILYQDLIKNSKDYFEPVQVESNDPLFVLYTSGTTGKPKGIVHSTGGYLTYVNYSYNAAFGDTKNSVYWCTADVGWVTGHSYAVYAPLMNGATSVIYEGAPDFPNPSIWWKLIEKYKVNILYTSPTAIRMLRKLGEEWLENIDLSSLKVLGSVGEIINPDIWQWFFERIGGSRCPIIDTWWQTETGGFMICPKINYKLEDLKAGSPTFPLDEIEIDILDEDGKSVPVGQKGYLVIKNFWPGLTLGIWGDNKRFEETYWSKFKDAYYPGDYAIKDKDGYIWFLGRSDETLNIAGHRIGTGEIENAVVKNINIAETAVAAIPDKIKGQNFVLFVVLKQNNNLENIILEKEIINTLKIEIGALAKPAKIYFVESLPKTRSGKIMRRVLSSLLQKSDVGDLTTLENISCIDNIRSVIALDKI